MAVLPKGRKGRTLGAMLRSPLLAPLLFLASCQAFGPAGPALPDPPREFRGAWVATVANIDWPSRPGLDPAVQRSEAESILDRLAELNMNAVVLQVRPHCDALYASELEPWSAYLTGLEGRPPEPLYDPLAFWIEEAHARGLQLHAWFNPYRAAHPGRPGPPAESSVLVERPEMCVALGDGGYRWLDPARADVQRHSLEVILDVVRRYDVDGVHFDDYFYPYPSYADGADFPDGETWEAYRAGGGRLSRGDWRRDAVDRFVRRVGREVHRVDPEVLVSVSPFGIWRPGEPDGIAGFDAHDELYADARRWLRRGWVDALVPQLYWPIAQVPQSFPVLLGWWERQNPMGRHVWAGTSIARMQDDDGPAELVGQIMVTRGMTPRSPGTCLFSARWLLQEGETLGEALEEGPFARAALPPESGWLESSTPRRPRLEASDASAVTFQPGEGEAAPLAWLLDVEIDGSWQQSVLTGREAQAALSGRATRVALRAVSRAGVVGRAAWLKLGGRGDHSK